MKLRNMVGATVGGMGLAATANKLLAARAGDLDPLLPGDQATYNWRGFDVTYTEGGDPDDPDLLLYHGINASGSSYEFRGIFDALTDSYHVLAPDLPGFGRSDRPPLLYSGSLYTTFVEDFARDLATDATVVASSLAGGYAAVAAKLVDFEELFLICPTVETFSGRRTWLRSLVRTPVLGEGLYNLATSRAAIRYFNADHGYYDTANVTDELVATQWTAAHQPGARFAPASFFGGFLDLDVNLADVLSGLDVPVTLVWGRQASTTPLSRGEQLADEANARLIVFDKSDVQPHVEHGEQFVKEVIHGEPVAESTVETDIEIEGPGGHTETERSEEPTGEDENAGGNS